MGAWPRVLVLLVAGAAAAEEPSFPLVGLRASFKTSLPEAGQTAGAPSPKPPVGVLERVEYQAPLGKNAAYVTPVRKGPKRPAVLWIAGGFDWGIDEGSWVSGPPDNDQSAAVFREAGLVLMHPSLRGCDANPGRREYFLGEVDDILAAAEYLAKRPDVDPTRIYLGGHSTGGTLALLAAESTARFRAVFAFGAVGRVSTYGDRIPVKASQHDEIRVRSPLDFLSSIVTPTFIIEGSEGNVQWFPFMRRAAGSAPVHFIPLLGLNHFNVLRPMSALIAKKMLADTGPVASFQFTDAELDEVVVKVLGR